MAKRKKKSVSLPRVTVLAYNRRDLLAFVEAVNSVKYLVSDLLTITDRVHKKKKAVTAELATPPLPGTT